VQRGPETPFQEQEPKTEGGWKKAHWHSSECFC
jgi:hypothetical protein